MNTSINLLNVFHRESEILPVVLCGGSGTRLWPLSRKAMPKQFVPLFKEASLLQLTLRRLKSFGTHILAVGNEDHRFHIQEAFEKESLQSTIFLEPFPKNTAAAMAIAALSVKPNQLLLFTPSDHYIKDTEAFAAAIKKGLSGANAGLCVTFGVVPDYPSTAYGYLRTTQWVSGADEHSDDTLLGTSRVEQFIEKPHTDLAEHLIKLGNCYWNAGIFLVHAKVYWKLYTNILLIFLKFAKNQWFYLLKTVCLFALMLKYSLNVAANQLTMPFWKSWMRWQWFRFRGTGAMLDPGVRWQSYTEGTSTIIV